MSPSGALGGLPARTPMLGDAASRERFHSPSRTKAPASGSGVTVEVAVSRSAKVTAATPSAEMHTAPRRGSVKRSTPKPHRARA